MVATISQEALRKAAQDYERDGFAVIENFFSEEEVEQIRKETVDMVRDESSRLNKDGQVHQGEIWENPDKNEYYVACADGKTRLFYEPYAVDKNAGKLALKPEEGICKMGFALHRNRPFFMDIVRRKKITDMFRALDYINPTLIQTMVNFKNPKVGGEFIPHQDTSYLTTTDPSQVVGFWFALDDATVENGCLDIIPGSHKWALNRKYVKVKEGKKADGSILEWTGPMAVYDERMYIKAPCKRGALILIHGLLVHKSEPNRTEKSRWAFAFHAFDSGKCKWVDGWLPSTCPAFVPIYAN